jgi:DNA-binding response OmpR family regulator
MRTKVLLIGENPQGYSLLADRLEAHGFKCRFATTYQEAVSLLSLQEFELVLSPMRVRHSSIFPLISLLESSQTTLFYFQAVEEGCWWLPALRFGRNCFGSHALRPSEFIALLDAVIDEIRKGQPVVAKNTVSATQTPRAALPRPITRSATAIPVRVERPGLAKSTATG